MRHLDIPTDTFIESGGHLARFAGNQIWQARREDDRLVCYKAAAEKADPVRNNPKRRHLLTSIWESKGVDWPPAKTWGANGVRGIYAKLGGFSPRASGGLTVYREILNSHSARHVVMIGDSAGGGLIMTSVLRMREEGLPMPAALGLLSPWADISTTGTSLYDLANGGDPIIDWDRNLVASAKLYAGDTPLKDPAVSPLYADFSKGFPPCYISTGTKDLFLSHCARLQRKLTDAGVNNRLFVYKGMFHVFQQDLNLPESEAAWRDLANFLEGHWVR